ncbi:MAG: NUDIX hydrolase [Bacteroides sp. SM23_62_1]|nr:MAG: NUDIX hydrolase [Bacteroides sp. SM23_62_1]
MKHFNIRVYGIIINAKNEVLISDEYLMDMKMTKFPGGGLRFGEGTLDCIKREAVEEFGQEIDIIRHYYTTDFFQKALFYEDHQLISIYYLARFTRPPVFPTSKKPYDFEMVNGSQSFRWYLLERISPDLMTFPVDKIVAEMLKDDFNQGLL